MPAGSPGSDPSESEVRACCGIPFWMSGFLLVLEKDNGDGVFPHLPLPTPDFFEQRWLIEYSLARKKECLVLKPKTSDHTPIGLKCIQVPQAILDLQLNF